MKCHQSIEYIFFSQPMGSTGEKNSPYSAILAQLIYAVMAGNQINDLLHQFKTVNVSSLFSSSHETRLAFVKTLFEL